MSKTNITQYFFPGQVKIMGQSFSPDYCEVVISMRPNLRFTPRCSECGGKTLASHDTTKRLARILCLEIRDLNLAATVVWLNLLGA